VDDTVSVYVLDVPGEQTSFSLKPFDKWNGSMTTISFDILAFFVMDAMITYLLVYRKNTIISLKAIPE
jgi:hypothetical protein